MSSSFYAKDAIVQDRALKVESLVIPFLVTHSATPANVVLSNDEPNILFMQSQGVDQISQKDDTAADQFNNQSPSDASGQLNILVDLGSESALKVMRASIVSRTDGSSKACYPDVGGSPSGISSDGQIMLYAPTGVNVSTTDLDACLIVEYTVSGTGN